MLPVLFVQRNRPPPKHDDFAPNYPGHLQQAQAALAEAGIPVGAGTSHPLLPPTPQVSQTDAMRRERNRIQDELETVSNQLQQERRKTHRLEQELSAALKMPKSH